MLSNLHHSAPADPSAEAQRHAYNGAFEELGLSWHWDSATFAWVQARGNDGVRTYLENEHPHLLLAYRADFLVNAIEAAKARRLADTDIGMVRALTMPYAARATESFSRPTA
jgi:hypothetical protein